MSQSPGSPEASRMLRWHPSLRQQLIGMVVLFALVASLGALYQRSSSIHDAERATLQGLMFRANLAAQSVGNGLKDEHAGTADVAGFYAEFPDAAKDCHIKFIRTGSFRKGHSDVVDSSGKVLCTSAKPYKLPTYANAPWLGSTSSTSGPVHDPISDHPAIVVVEPIKGVGAVVTFLELPGVLNRLATRLSGPLSSEFVLSDSAGRTVAVSPAVTHGDVLSVTVPVPPVGWNLRVSTTRNDAVEGAVALSNRLFLYLLIAFLLLLVAVQLVYAGMARPIRRLNETVRDIAPGDVPEGLKRSGPAEVVSLGEAFDLLTRAVRDELSARHAAEAAHAAVAKERDAQAAMLNLVVQSSPAMIYVKDLEGRYLMVNSAYERAIGVSQDDVLGRTDLDINPDLDALWRANDRKALDGLYHLEEKLDGPRGTRYYEGVKFPLHDASGTVYAVCGVSLDVTEQRRAITATAEARDAAMAANAAKSAFLATMSHEIRTPMNAVIGMTDLLEQTKLDVEQREFVTTVRTSGEALMAVISNILDFSKIESGELDLEVAPFMLREEIESCLDLVARPASAKGVDLLFDITERCPSQVVGDATRLRQILTNLLSNAVKFTEAGEVFVEVDCVDGGDDTLLLAVTVTDTGIGIPKDSRERLFRSFSQVDASTTRIYGGTGLGLAISRRLAQAMGGDITVTDNPHGHGTRFAVTVRVRGGVDAEYAAGRPDVIAPILAGRSVLLVDDNETNLRILQLQLTRLGMTCATASSAGEALDQVRSGLSYDIGVLDLRMPDMDGIELGNSLKQMPGPSAAAPLILLTSVGWRRNASEHSFAALLSKPVKSTSLRDALTALLSERPRQRLEPAETEAQPTEPRRILLAEDNAVNQRVVQLMLKSLGHTVDVVADGEAAVRAVEESQYDVVLMDVQMPRMDGLEATRRIRTGLPDRRQPHIVALTASALVEDREACAAAGMEAYLTKPVRKRELQAMLERTTVSSGAASR